MLVFHLLRLHLADSLGNSGDERKPVCSKCSSRGESCEWDTGIKFRNRGIDASPPSTRRFGGNRRSPNEGQVSRVVLIQHTDTGAKIKHC